MPNPFFSIIVPAYNSEKFLGDCIQSAVDQSIDDWELVIIDDGSSDSTLTLANKWAAEDSRIHVFHHAKRANHGVSSSRNLAINNSNGNWLAFLDADDYWLPEKLEVYLKVIQEHPDVVFIYSQADVIDKDGQGISLNPELMGRSHVGTLYGSGILGETINSFNRLLKSNFNPPTSSVTIRKDIFYKTGGFDPTMSYAEDTLLWYQVMLHGNTYFIDKPLVHYRIHENQWNADKSSDLKVCRRLLLYSKLLKLVPPEKKRQVSAALISVGLKNILRSKLIYPQNNLRLIREKYIEVLAMKNLGFEYKLLSVGLLFFEFLIVPLKFIYFRYVK